MKKNIALALLVVSLVASVSYNFHQSERLTAENAEAVARSINGVLLYPSGTANLVRWDESPQSGPMVVYRDYHSSGSWLVCGQVKPSQSARTGFETSRYIEPVVDYMVNISGARVAVVKFTPPPSQ